MYWNATVPHLKIWGQKFSTIFTVNKPICEPAWVGVTGYRYFENTSQTS